MCLYFFTSFPSITVFIPILLFHNVCPSVFSSANTHPLISFYSIHTFSSSLLPLCVPHLPSPSLHLLLSLSDSGGSRECRLQSDGQGHHADYLHYGKGRTPAACPRDDWALEAWEGLYSRYTCAHIHTHKPISHMQSIPEMPKNIPAMDQICTITFPPKHLVTFIENAGTTMSLS